MATPIEDKTSYIVPHVKKSAEKTGLYLQHMLTQVSTLRNLFDNTQSFNLQWEYLVRRFPELQDVVDRTSAIENLPPISMQENLIRLYKTYVAEWDNIQSSTSGDLFNSISHPHST
jgi:glutathionylspermidine synthase